MAVAAAHFNASLFGSRLPPALITFQRKKRCYGYFSYRRFVNKEGIACDEIALNPSLFATSSAEDVLSTLVHEQAHQWIAHSGKPCRRGYHDRQWGKLMLSLGLCPSSTGKPGGRTTGEKMSHYVVEGGPFILACRILLKTLRPIVWYDRAVHDDSPPPTEQQPPSVPSEPVDMTQWTLETAIEDPPPAALLDATPVTAIPGFADLLIPPSMTSATTRAKYACRACRASVWGKPGLQIGCLGCSRAFEEVRKTTLLGRAGRRPSVVNRSS